MELGEGKERTITESLSKVQPGLASLDIAFGLQNNSMRWTPLSLRAYRNWATRKHVNSPELTKLLGDRARV